jgi:hypothetical protein
MKMFSALALAVFASLSSVAYAQEHLHLRLVLTIALCVAYPIWSVFHGSRGTYRSAGNS